MKRDPRIPRLSELAVAAMRGPLGRAEVTELGRLVLDVGACGRAAQATEKDERIRRQREEITRLHVRVAELEAQLTGRAA